MAGPCAGADHLGPEVEASVEVRGGAWVRGVCVAVVPAAVYVWGWFRAARELREPQYNEGMCQDAGSSGGARFLVRSWTTKRPGTESSGGTEGPRVWERERRGGQGDGVPPREGHKGARNRLARNPGW